jgi:hypothetical protein
VRSTPTAVAKISTSDAITIDRCDGAISKTHLAIRTVNHSLVSIAAASEDPLQSQPAIVVRKHSPKIHSDAWDTTMKTIA